MENRKDIGKAINDRLSSLDKTPREQVWVGINEELQKKKKRRFAFFFFWTRVIGLLLVGAIATIYVYQNDSFNLVSPNSPKENKIVNDSNNTNADDKNKATGNNGIENSKENVSKSNSSNEITAEDENLGNGSNSNNNKFTDKKSGNKNGNKLSLKSAAKGTAKNNSNFSSKASKSKLYSKVNKKKSAKNSKAKSKKEDQDLKSLDGNSSKKDSAFIDLTSLQGKKTDELISEIKSKKTDSLKAKKEKDKDLTKNSNMYQKEKKDSLPVLTYKKFDFDVYVSPTYYGFISKGSTLDRRLDSLPKKSEMKFSYGVGLTYDMSDKLSVRIGYSKVNLSYVTKNAPVNISNYNGIAYKPNISNATIYAASNGDEKMDITQKISYTEIPFEVKYKFLDKKIGLKSSLGFSYFILDENKISIKTDSGYSQEIGKTKDLSKAGLSVNLGVEADYPLFKNMKIFVEPIFHYQIKAFSDSAFKPYYFGIHTGIRYSLNN